MQRILRVVAVALAVVALASSVRAADLELFVKNRPFKGPTAMRSGTLYASLETLLGALGYSWRLTGDRVDLSRTAGGGPTLPGGQLQLFEDGKPVNASVVDIGGRAMVDVSGLARSMGLSYKTTPAMGTADLNVPVGKSQVADTWGREKTPETTEDGDGKDGDGDGKDGDGKKPEREGGKVSGEKLIETDGNNKNSPITVVKTDFSDSTTPGAQFVGEVRTSTTIKNAGEDPLEKVTLYLRLQNMAGETVQEWTYDIGDMKAGATVSFTPDPPIWYNYNKIQVQPKVIVKHLELVEPAKIEDGKKESDTKAPAGSGGGK